MQFMALTRRRTEQFSDAEFESRLPAEVAQARRYHMEGFFRQIWHRADMGGACILLEADSLESARGKLEALPMHQQGMLEIMSLVPLKPYAGWAQ